MKAMDIISAIITKVIRFVLVIMFIFMLFALTLQVFGRYLFSAGFPWSEESARFLMIWMTYLGAVHIILNDEHVKVTIIEDLFKGIHKKILITIQDVICLVFSIAVFIYSFEQLKITSLSVAQNISLQMSVIYLVFPICAALMIIAYIFKIIKTYISNEPCDGNESSDSLTEGGTAE